MISAKGQKELGEILGDIPMGFQEYISKMETIIEKYRNVTRIADSFSDDEIHSKSVLVKAIESQELIDKTSTVVIWGCWYGSILIPYFSSRVARVIGIDQDDEVIKFAKNKLFSDEANVELITDDIFKTYRNFYLETNLIVNTSCEYMPLMKDWPWFKHGALETDIDYPRGAADRDPSKKRIFGSPKLATKCHFAFQSSDLLGGGGINFVRSLEDFKAQLPLRAEVHLEMETPIEGGRKFTLIGDLT
jgi:hypothetical protein